MSPLQPRRRGARLSLLLAAALLLAEPAVGARAGVDPATAEIVDLLRPDAALRAGAAPHGRAMAGALREVEVTVDRFATRYQVDYLRALSFPVFFTRDGGALTPESRGQLRALGEALKAPELAGERFLVAGHADAGTHEARNIELSYARARAVRDYLVDAFGIDPRRLVIAGWGSSRRLEGYPPRSGIQSSRQSAAAGGPCPFSRSSRRGMPSALSCPRRSDSEGQRMRATSMGADPKALTLRDHYRDVKLSSQRTPKFS